MRISDWSSDVCSSDLDRGLYAWRGGATARDRPSQLLRDRRRRLRHLRHRPYRLFRGCRGMTDAYKIIDHTYDTVVVGAGGTALRATVGRAAAELNTGCITTGSPTRSHTHAPQG